MSERMEKKRRTDNCLVLKAGINSEKYKEPFEYFIANEAFDFDVDNVMSMLSNLEYKEELTDMMSFEKSNCFVDEVLGSHKYCDTLTRIRDHFMEDVRVYVEKETGLKLRNDYIELFFSKYEMNNYLLCHNDNDNDTRAVAFILYVNNNEWNSMVDGGNLNLFETNEQHLPMKLVKTIEPLNNRFIFFPTSLDSYHSVEEVYSNEKIRYALSGWFHYKKEKEEAVTSSNMELKAEIKKIVKEVYESDMQEVAVINDNQKLDDLMAVSVRKRIIDEEKMEDHFMVMQMNGYLRVHLFRDAPYKDLCNWIEKVNEDDWINVNLPYSHSYDYMAIKNFTKFPLLKGLLSGGVYTNIEMITAKNMMGEFLPDGVKCSLRRYKKSSFKMAYDVDFDEGEVEENISYIHCLYHILVPDEKDKEYGGYTTLADASIGFMANDGEEDESEEEENEETDEEEDSKKKEINGVKEEKGDGDKKEEEKENQDENESEDGNYENMFGSEDENDTVTIFPKSNVLTVANRYASSIRLVQYINSNIGDGVFYEFHIVYKMKTDPSKLAEMQTPILSEDLKKLLKDRLVSTYENYVNAEQDDDVIDEKKESDTKENEKTDKDITEVEELGSDVESYEDEDVEEEDDDDDSASDDESDEDSLEHDNSDIDDDEEKSMAELYEQYMKDL
ncbi:hypothetical protein SNEBB_002161 [Seison nebaliae]|nr:hypothetical protein SNEBB_002161 [Seison nebaliae]